MDHSQGWQYRRYLTLSIVIAAHLACLAALLMTSAVKPAGEFKPHPIELLSLPPTKIPKIRPENLPPQRISSNAAVSVAPPVLGSLVRAPPSSGSDGKGAGVDWGAEARRALQAFEIRSSKPAGNTYNAGSSAQDDWWPRAQHHAGEQYKTSAGDWIVWVSSTCYQLASAAAPLYAPGAMLSPTICSDPDVAAGGTHLAQPPRRSARPAPVNR